MSTIEFHPLVDEWFRERFGAPTEPQRLGWPHIAAGKHTLIAAPTGSGKTLTAFLVCLDRLVRQWLDGKLADGVQVVYVSPLKALSNDIQRNLQTPLAEIQQLAEAHGLVPPPIRTAVRTGDTPAAERQAMLKRPPHILVTTPESLYLLLTAEKSRALLASTETIIVDEIHALARDKRGSHLTLTLERLTALCTRAPVRIGLSATQRPVEDIARFLVGAANLDADGNPNCEIVDGGHVRQLDLAIEAPPSELSAVCSHEQWAEAYQRLTELINLHRSTLIFVNTRRLSERISHYLRELLGDDAVASHHGSLSRSLRLSAEQRLKNGELKAIVATASLEMGIDIGYIDLVCQIGSPRGIAAFLQRVGRSGHSLGKTPKGRLFPLTRDELLECMALVRAVRSGRLDAIEIPQAPLDILAQQIVAAVACEPWNEGELYELCRRAWPFRNLSAKDYEAIVQMLSEGLSPTAKRGAYLHRDRINGALRARRGARIAAITSGGAIPEKGEYRVVTEGDETFIGTLDEDFAIESQAGDVFLLGNSSWRVLYVRAGQVVVRDAQGAPPSVPFWFGEGPGRTIELSEEVSRLRTDLTQHVESVQQIGGTGGLPTRVESLTGRTLVDKPPAPSPIDRNDDISNLTDDNTRPLLKLFSQSDPNGDRADGNGKQTTPANSTSSPASQYEHAAAWLAEQCGADPWAAEQALRYVETQAAATGIVPTGADIVFERFFDESGGMQLVIHAPLGARINRAWGLSLRKRFCRSFDFELQAAADDNGIVLSMSPQHSLPIENLFSMIGPHNARYLVEQAVLAVPMFQVRWRWNVTRALAVLRMQGGKKTPPYLQRFRSDDLLAATFPETVGCLENHHGDVQIPDHPLVQQTMHDCLHEAMDINRWLDVLEDVKAGRIRLHARDTCEPSPFSQQLLNANPYAFLDDAPLEERRTRAVAARRGLSPQDYRDLASFDPEAIEIVRQQAWPLVRSADELHDALMNLCAVLEHEGGQWKTWFNDLVRAGRAAVILRPNQPNLWIAAERWPLVRAVYDEAVAEPPVALPPELDIQVERSDGWVELARGRVFASGPTSAAKLSQELGLEAEQMFSALEALEGQGVVLRGSFTSPPKNDANGKQDKILIEWCERRLLARIHRLTLDGLRKRIRPVEPADFLKFLVHRHHLDGVRAGGPAAVRRAIELLQGFELPAGAWEQRVLAPRVAEYDSQWLDQLFLSGEMVWGRLRQPKRDAERGASMALLTRTVPISLVRREDLPWLLPAERGAAAPQLRRNARAVLEALQARGALFLQELRLLSRLLPAQLEEALRELSALGLITSDAFAAVRSIVDGRRRNTRHRRGRTAGAAAAPNGRWSLFPGIVEPIDRDQYLDRWCRQLLARYGVLFRDLLAREYAAPAWRELAPVLRRMELRGEVCGGRFVSGVGGEQFAEEAAVEELREQRDRESGDWVVLSAADPLNLVGVITDEQRTPATHKNTLILQNGRCVAARQASVIEFFAPFDPPTEAAMRRALVIGRKPQSDASPTPLPLFSKTGR